MADVLTSLETLFIKKESTEGTAAVPAATDAILARNFKKTLAQEDLKRSFPGAAGTRAGVIGGRMGTGCSFETEVKAPVGGNTPEIDELLESAFGQVVAGTASAITAAETRYQFRFKPFRNDADTIVYATWLSPGAPSAATGNEVDFVLSYIAEGTS